MSEQNEKLSILLVEDNDFFLSLALQILKEFEVYSAKDGEQAIALYSKHKPDLCFVDIQLPKATGHEVVEKIRMINPDVFVVMVTASRLQEDIDQAMQGGAQEYIIKPFSKERIMNCVEQYHKYRETLIE